MGRNPDVGPDVESDVGIKHVRKEEGLVSLPLSESFE